MAKANKKTSKKKKAKARKSSPARTTKKASAKKRVVKKSRKASKKAAKKTVKKSVKTAKKAVKKSSKTPSKKPAKKSAAKKSVAVPKTPSAVDRTSSAEKKPAAAPRAKAPAAAAPAPAAPRDKVFYVTTPIFYPNGIPHIGHAYTAMVTDAIARFQRLDGFDVRFLTGTDEHGLKMQQTAVAEGLTPLALADRNSARFRDMMTALNISYDDYIRTTEPRHKRACQALWSAIEKNGDIYLDKYAGWYSVRQEAYFDEAETTVGDDGIRREPLGSPVEWTEEETYFFRLSAYQDKLLALYADVTDFVLPRERLNEVASFVKGGLKDLSVSRTTFDWGIEVPGAPSHVMYVWMDALTNYITAAGYPDVESAEFQRYWPANLHVTGKDIVRFHAVYWPAFLMSAGVEVPHRVFSHGFLLNRGEKMSKSVGNVVDPFAMAAQYGVDQIRYFFMREVSFGQDGSYNHEAIVARVNADLANDLGNLAQRSLSMIAKQLGGILPEPGEFSDNDKAILAQADGMLEASRTAMATQQIHQWLSAVWAVVAEANRYFAGEAPWALAKTDPARQKTVLYVTAEVVRQVAILAQPVMPESSAKLLDSLGIPQDIKSRNFAALPTRIAAGTALPAPVGVFPRYVEPKAD
ncbi:methionine--tRNA ligase [Bradyrhizobium sp. AUGA SZCCT0240]|uniref:methionine--tRNA ligase n=1 Tax=unclassified Bradyrhizobium TaxID=2631580 RepID=UPI001BAD1578|nr:MULTISPECIES: methionine--tRNA ligase [unclassified Bradyrhizobium]MBR1196458.1 methionine--tRNA ligase [Bradyrhizobium sp. AUGA SZCCT0158]MBR1241600.1 methionine--tRNA ligase [Bradyrhizobium sp. AUGA SZCCT0274]MBR1254676.1 methionine--tRNA ligase [Bradyrhizobium sp. AUGA SZCCT0240]